MIGVPSFKLITGLFLEIEPNKTSGLIWTAPEIWQTRDPEVLANLIQSFISTLALIHKEITALTVSPAPDTSLTSIFIPGS